MSRIPNDMTQSPNLRNATAQEELGDASRSMGVDISQDQADALLEFLKQLQRWNRTYNLTAIRNPKDMLQQHVLDSLAVLPHLDRWLATGEALPHAKAVRVMDVGSGGGLPGIVLALMRPTWQVLCVDAVEKKMSFVRQMRGVLALENLTAEHGRVEELSSVPPQHVVISRAFASLADFVSLAGRHVKPSGLLVAMKGKYPESELQELAQLHPNWRQMHHVGLEVPGLAAERCLLAFSPPEEVSYTPQTR